MTAAVLERLLPPEPGPRRARRAPYTLGSLLTDLVLTAFRALRALLADPPAPRHRAPDLFAPVARDLPAAGFSLPTYLASPSGRSAR